MHAWLTSLGLSERAIALAYGSNLSFGRDARDVSALLLLFRAAFSKAQRSLAPAEQIGYTAEGGVQRIPEAMAEDLRRPVSRSRAVVGVRLARDTDLVLRNAAVHLCDAAHDLERDLEKYLTDLVRRARAKCTLRDALIELMTDDEAQQRADRARGDEAENAADRFAEPLH
jgi:hypothetical protein